MKKEKLWSLYLFIALIVILFTSMLVLCGMYLNLRLNGITSSLPKIPVNDKWILTNSASDSHGKAGELISPVFMGVKNDASGMYAAVYDKDARDYLNKQIEPKMTALFNGNAEKINLHSDEEKKQFVKNTMLSDDYIFISFYNQLPSSAILPGIYGSGSYMPLNENFDVKYVFILPEEDTVKGICFDKKLNAVELSPLEKIAFDKNDYSAYNEINGFASFEFISETYPEPVFTESFDIKSLLMSQSFSFFRFDLSDARIKQLLTILDFNTNLVKTYTYNENDVISFVGEEKELYVSRSDNMLYYNGYDAGIHMSEYLNYYPQNDGYTFTDTVLCLKYLLNSIDRILVGGDAPASIVSVSHVGDDTVFKLKYFYNGIMVTDKPYDISVVIDGEFIKSIEIGVLFCDSGNLNVPVIPQKLAMNVFDKDEFKEGIASCNAMLTQNEETGRAELTWVVRKDAQ